MKPSLMHTPKGFRLSLHFQPIIFQITEIKLFLHTTLNTLESAFLKVVLKCNRVLRCPEKSESIGTFY